MSAMREAFNEDQIALVLEALTEKSKRCRSAYKTIKESGYGKGSTLDKAEAQLKKSNEIDELTSYISTEFN